MTKISQLSSIGDSLAIGDQFLIRDIDDAGSPNKSVTVSGITRALADGDATAPALAFAADKNTGIYRAGTDSLAVATNGTGRLFINSNGSVTAPQGTFTLGTSGAANAVINSADGIFLNIDSDNTTTGEVFVVGKDRTGASGGSELFRITEAGLVGIGTSAPGYLLDLSAGTPSLRITSTTTTGTTIGNKGNRLLLQGESFTLGNGGEIVFAISDTNIGRWGAITSAIQANSAGGASGSIGIATK